MKYRHINTGTLVESSTELPASVFEKVEDKPKPTKRATRNKAARATKKED